MNGERREEEAAMGEAETETEVTRTAQTATGGDANPHGTTPAAGVADELTKVRQLVLRAHPDVVPELVGGNSIDELLASVEPARSAYQQVADRVRAGESRGLEGGAGTTVTAEPAAAANATRQTTATGSPPLVPAGGAANVVNLDDIPPAEKIARALAGRRQGG
jgi:hypothetical protein